MQDLIIIITICYFGWWTQDSLDIVKDKLKEIAEKIGKEKP